MDAATTLDTVEYPASDDMGEHEVQRFITELLRALIERWLRAQRRVAHAGANQFFYYAKGDPRQCLAPDVYVVDGVAQDIPDVAVWKTWEGHRPAFALEVVSGNWQKDYDSAPRIYDAMRASEVVLFDPGATARSRRRVRWQVFRRVRGRGFVCVERSSGDRVRSRSLGVWIRAVQEGPRVRLRLATGARGEEVLPSDAEVAAAEQLVRRIAEAQAEAERDARRAAESAARDETAARIAAESAARDEAAARIAAESAARDEAAARIAAESAARDEAAARIAAESAARDEAAARIAAEEEIARLREEIARLRAGDLPTR
jgi:hypothetical protein